jgi:phosphoserine phosphatase RsbU/P
MRLEATGLPLGLFSHATHSAGTCVLLPQGVLLVVSRGVIETEREHEEFGLENVMATLRHASAPNASAICLTILEAIQKFLGAAPTHNDVTALALLRRQAAELPSQLRQE